MARLMHVTVEIPDQKASHAVDSTLARQLAEFQRQLLHMVSAKQTSATSLQEMMVERLDTHQDALLAALERLIRLMGKTPATPDTSTALSEALTGLQQTMAELPKDLKEALDGQYQQLQTKLGVSTSAKPHVTVQMPQRLMERIDSLEAALLTGLRRSRSRTFGSNY